MCVCMGACMYISHFGSSFSPPHLALLQHKPISKTILCVCRFFSMSGWLRNICLSFMSDEGDASLLFTLFSWPWRCTHTHTHLLRQHCFLDVFINACQATTPTLPSHHSSSALIHQLIHTILYNPSWLICRASLSSLVTSVHINFYPTFQLSPVHSIFSTRPMFATV